MLQFLKLEEQMFYSERRKTAKNTDSVTKKEKSVHYYDLGAPYIEKNCIFKDSVPIMGGRVWGNPNSLSSHKLGHIFQVWGG